MRELSITIFLIICINELCIDVEGSKLITPRIIGGSVASKGLAPYMVALVLGGRVKSMICGASIISEMHVLTAAHCIDAVTDRNTKSLLPTLHGMVGSNYWMSAKTRVKFGYFINHPDWDYKTIKNDVGVLVQESKLELNERTQVIALNFDWVEGSVDSFVTGWGVTDPTEINDIVNLSPTPDKLQFIAVKTLSPHECYQGMINIPQTINPVYVDSEIELCAFHSAGHGVCNGDSGSPLVSSDLMEQIGIVSWGFCNKAVPDVFVRLSAFKSFLMGIIS